MDVKDGPKPTKSELRILRILWDRGPSTVREVIASLGPGVGYTTALKTMQIMADKGLLARDERGPAHVYRPVERESASKRNLVGDLLDRAFGGSVPELVLHALAAKPASPEEVAAIREMLDQVEAQRG